MCRYLYMLFSKYLPTLIDGAKFGSRNLFFFLSLKYRWWTSTNYGGFYKLWLCISIRWTYQMMFRSCTRPCSGPLYLVCGYLNILCLNWLLLTNMIVWFNALSYLREYHSDGGGATCALWISGVTPAHSIPSTTL